MTVPHATVPDPALLGAKVTAILLIVVVHLVVTWDVFAGLKWGSQATVSYVLNQWIEEKPILVLAAGILLGHICWPLRR